MRLFIMLFLSVLFCSFSTKADVCQAIAVRDVPAIDDPKYFIKKGDIDRAITEYRVDILTGETSYCSHGGGCYLTHIKVGDDYLIGLKMTNCKVVRKGMTVEDNLLVYGLEPDRSMIPAKDMREEDVTDSMSRLGLCSACASNAAWLYTHHPESRCGKLVQSALEGNPASINSLSEYPGFCALDKLPPEMSK